MPVVDLLDGVVVHAVRGERARYAPLQTPLSDSPAPWDVLHGLLRLHPFRHCYVADLNAIQGCGDGDHEIARLAAQHRDVEFWVDAAFGARAALPVYTREPNVRCVIGSESLATFAAYESTRARCTGALDPILSLDHHRGHALGPEGLFGRPDAWTPSVIAMNLDHVGSALGPDFALLDALAMRAPHCARIAAGGVRSNADLEALRTRGVAAVLIASALHDGRLTEAALRAFSAET
ncbi:MAG: HisA/HisF-related TIM barrel protein [Gammaproteobacteria bacterium]